MTLPAPLLAIPDVPVPRGAQGEWFTGAGGARLRAALFPPRGPVRGSIVVSTGRTEPIEKYFEVVEDLRDRGLWVLVHEWRGQGLSHRELTDRLLGHAQGYRAFLQDYEALLEAFQARLPKPWWALGHSMGGCLTLLALAHGRAADFNGAILSAPMLGLRTGSTPLWRARAMAAVNVLLGRGGLPIAREAASESFETNVLTHDRRRWERAKAQVDAHPDLALGGPTWGWLDFALRATAYLARPAHLKSVTIPVVICSAEQERLVDNAAQGRVAAHLPQAEFISVPGAYHEILMETDPMRNIFLRALDALLGRTTHPDTAIPAPAPTAAAREAETAEPRPAAAPGNPGSGPEHPPSTSGARAAAKRRPRTAAAAKKTAAKVSTAERDKAGKARSSGAKSKGGSAKSAAKTSASAAAGGEPKAGRAKAAAKPAKSAEPASSSAPKRTPREAAAPKPSGTAGRTAKS